MRSSEPTPTVDPETRATRLLAHLATLLWRIAFDLAFAAAVIWPPPLQTLFGTRGLGLAKLAIVAPFPVLVWGSDDLRGWALRRRTGRTENYGRGRRPPPVVGATPPT